MLVSVEDEAADVRHGGGAEIDKLWIFKHASKNIVLPREGIDGDHNLGSKGNDGK